MSKRVLLIDERQDVADRNAELLWSLCYDVTVCTDLYRARGRSR